MKIGSLGLPEILILLVVVLLIFGPRRLPEMAKGLGQSVREFRKGLRDMRKDLDDEGVQSTTAKGPSVAAATVQPSGASPVGPAAPAASEAAASGPAASGPATSGPATEASVGATEAAPAGRDA